MSSFSARAWNLLKIILPSSSMLWINITRFHWKCFNSSNHTSAWWKYGGTVLKNVGCTFWKKRARALWMSWVCNWGLVYCWGHLKIRKAETGCRKQTFSWTTEFQIWFFPIDEVIYKLVWFESSNSIINQHFFLKYQNTCCTVKSCA